MVPYMRVDGLHISGYLVVGSGLSSKLSFRYILQFILISCPDFDAQSYSLWRRAGLQDQPDS